MVFPDGFMYQSKMPGLRTLKGARQIFCSVRNTWLQFSAEEFVRQAYINYLMDVTCVPLGLIQVEHAFMLHQTVCRFDVVVYNPDRKPWLLVELKSPKIKLNQEVLDQAQRYNLVINAPWLVVSNGLQEVVFYKNIVAKQLEPFKWN